METQRLMNGGEDMCRDRCYNCGVTELKDLRYICGTPDSAQWEVLKICNSCRQFYIINRGDHMGGGFDYVTPVSMKEVRKIFTP